MFISLKYYKMKIKLKKKRMMKKKNEKRISVYLYRFSIKYNKIKKKKRMNEELLLKIRVMTSFILHAIIINIIIKYLLFNEIE